jgi:hypothetical protein
MRIRAALAPLIVASALAAAAARGDAQAPLTPPPGYGAPPVPLGPSLLSRTDWRLSAGATFGAARVSAFDDLLSGYGFENDRFVGGGELEIERRTLRWLWLGGRGVLRARRWESAGVRSIEASALCALAVADARVPLGRSVEVALGVGLGLGVVTLLVNDVPANQAAPAANASVALSFGVAEPVRTWFRLSWDWLDAANVDDAGHALPMGGMSFGMGVEIRL